MRGKCEKKDVFPYMAVQVLGAAAAALIVGFQKGNPVLTPNTHGTSHALVNEFLFTFALAFVVLKVATSKNHPETVITVWPSVLPSSPERMPAVRFREEYTIRLSLSELL